jgi:hypothetical protein
MYLIQQTELFSKWLHKLKDIKGKVAIIKGLKESERDIPPLIISEVYACINLSENLLHGCGGSSFGVFRVLD